jgi:hypothetical protein
MRKSRFTESHFDAIDSGRPFRTLNVIDKGNREGLRLEIATSIPSLRVIRIIEIRQPWPGCRP